jgi:hypothetical protein
LALLLPEVFFKILPGQKRHHPLGGSPMPRIPRSEREKRRLLWIFGSTTLLLLIVVGIFAKNDWLPHTDTGSGKKFGWFGHSLPKTITSSVWNPMMTTSTPQLSKEYIYAGSRLLAVEDANANAAPPTDLAIWRPSDGNWWVLGGPGSALVIQPWGMSADKPAPGDYDGDGKTDFAIFRPSDGNWWVINSSTGSGGVPVSAWGASTDVPVAADFDGDGKTDFALWRPSPAGFWIRQSSDGARYNVTYGSSGDLPSAADYDGDGKADVAIFSNSLPGFIWKSSRDGQVYTQVWGASGDKPIPGDYDGDGKADFATIHVQSNSQFLWSIRRSSDGGAVYMAWGDGNDGDIPVQNDYDGDGKCDIAIWRSSNGYWWIAQSSAGVRVQQWGMSGDIPVPANYRR